MLIKITGTAGSIYGSQYVGKTFYAIKHEIGSPVQMEWRDAHSSVFTGQAAYVIYGWPNSMSSGSLQRYAVPENKLEIVQDAPAPTKKVLSNYRDNSNMRQHLLLGDVVEVMKLEPNASYWTIISGKGEGQILTTSNVTSWTEDYVNPGKEVVVKVTRPYNYFGSGANGVHLLAWKHGGKYQFTSGKSYGQEFHASDVTEVEGELENLKRRCVVGRQLHISDNAMQILTANRHQEVGQRIHNLTLPIAAHAFNFYEFAANGPDYIDIDPTDCTKVTCIDHQKALSVIEKGGDPYNNPSRYTTTPGKLAAKMIVAGLFSERSVELFSQAWAASAKNLFAPEEDRPEILMVHGEDVAKYYDESKYMVGQGSLNNSCMRYRKVNSFLKIYTDNPEQVGLFIIRDRNNGQIYARALAWHYTDKKGVEQKYVDRRYGINEVEETRLLKKAQELGYKDIWQGGRDRCEHTVEIPLTLTYFQQFPYMDSMAYLDVENSVLCNKPAKGRSQMRQTGGTREFLSNMESQCAVSQNWVPLKKMEQTMSGAYALKEYVKPLNNGRYELEKNCSEDQMQGGYIYKPDAIKVLVFDANGKTSVGNSLVTDKGNPNIRYIRSNDCAVQATDAVYSKMDKAFILKKDAISMPDGTYCSAAKSELYLAYLRRKSGNKAYKKAAVHEVPVVA